MLVRAHEKSATDAGGAVPFLESDALRLPFANESFDLVTAAFGFRNLTNYEAGLREMQRVLKPGGTIGILEFTEPPAGFFGDFYRWYFRKVLPKIGGAISGDAAAYKYLPNSVARFFQPDELCDLMRGIGLQNVGGNIPEGTEFDSGRCGCNCSVSAEMSGPSERITARSIAFCSSRTLPGQR